MSTWLASDPTRRRGDPRARRARRRLLSLRTRDEARRFLRDLCTLAELEALAHRWQTVRLLEEHVPYLEIAERVHTSTATVTRVAQWLRNGAGGYRTALDRTHAKRKR